MAVRLVGSASARRRRRSTCASSRRFVDRHHPLAAVDGPFNAVMLQGDAIREITLEGPGAGGLATASAVVADMVSVIGTTGHAASCRTTPAGARSSGCRRRPPLAVLPPTRGRRPPGRARARRRAPRRSTTSRSRGSAQRQRERRGVARPRHARGADRAASRGGCGDRRSCSRCAASRTWSASSPSAASDDRAHRALPRPAPGRADDADRDARRGRHAAPPRAAALGAARPRRLAQVGGREPDRLLQGPRHDRRRLAGAATRACGRSSARRRATRRRRPRRTPRAPGCRRSSCSRPARSRSGSSRRRGRSARACSRCAARSTRRSPRRASSPTRGTHALVNSLNPYRLQGQKTAAFEIVDELGDAARRPRAPVRRRRQHLRLRDRVRGGGRRGAAHRRGRRRRSAPQTAASAIRIADPAHAAEVDAALERERRPIVTVADDAILEAWRALAHEEGVFCEPASAAGRRRARGSRARAGRARSSA